MAVLLRNNVTATLATALSATDTGIALTSGHGARFPSLGAGEYFYATLSGPTTGPEIVKVTTRVGDALTVVRAQEGTVGQHFPSGGRVEMRVTAASITDLVDEHDQASEITIADAGNYYTSTNVEGALQELRAPVVNNFTGNGSTVAYTLSSALGFGTLTDIHIDGVYQYKNTYTVSGTTLTFSEAPPLNAAIEVVVR